jgi:cytochrome bd ubiquinol oxidase subunit II
MDLAVLWALILAFAIAAYVLMDGFDLGIGILFWLFRPGGERDQAMNAIAPFWDGNETWLVMGGAGLLAAFPLAYAIILPALYAPIIAMLLGLIFRGVAFEFRWRNPDHRPLWDAGFTAGSLLATLMQGVAIGALVQGISVAGRAYTGYWWEWLSPFSLLTGISLIVGYALLGSSWLIWRTQGQLQAHARRIARLALLAMLAAVAAVSLSTPFVQPQYFGRWFRTPGLLVAVPMPLLVAATAYAMWRSIGGRREWMPFVLVLLLFLLNMIGLGISIWPDAVPGRVTIWDAAAPATSQKFLLVGALILIPLILGYTGLSYWVFRGKVGEQGYH